MTTLPITVLKSDGQTTTSSWGFSAGAGINAYGVRLVYQSSDLVAATTSAALGTGTTTSSSVSATGTSNTGMGMKPSGKLSTGEIIAIAVVVPLVALAILGTLFGWLWRKKRVGYKTPDAQTEIPAHHDQSHHDKYPVGDGEPVWGPRNLNDPKGGTTTVEHPVDTIIPYSTGSGMREMKMEGIDHETPSELPSPENPAELGSYM